jgi:hypothetical protein
MQIKSCKEVCFQFSVKQSIGELQNDVMEIEAHAQMYI